MGFIFPSYLEAVRQVKESQNPSIQENIELAIPPEDGLMIQEEVEHAIGALNAAKNQLNELNLARAELSLSDEFLTQEVLSLKDLKKKMGLFFENELHKTKDELNEIKNLKETKKHSELFIAKREEKELQSISREGQGILKPEFVGSFKEDFNWDEVATLTKLKKAEKFVSLLKNRADLVDRYEEIRANIEGDKDQVGLKWHAICLRRKKEQLIQEKNAYIEKLTGALGFQPGFEYSTKFKYLLNPFVELIELNVFDPARAEAFSELKAMGVEAAFNVKEHFKLEIVEAYLRMKVFKEYCLYIDLRFGTERDFFDPHLNAKKEVIKIELANALNLSSYFWNSSNPIDASSFPDLMKRLENLNEMVPKRLRDQLNERDVERLIESLHNSGLICEIIERVSLQGKKEKPQKALDLELYSEPLKTLPEEFSSYFKVMPNKKGHISDKITEYIRVNRQSFDLREVLPVIDENVENLFFKGRYPSLFYQNQHTLFWNDPQKRNDLHSLHHVLERIENTEDALMQEKGRVDPHLSGFATNVRLFLSDEIQGYHLLAYQKKLSILERKANALLDELPIGTFLGESLISKLHKISEFLQAPCQDVEESLDAKASSLEMQILALQSGEKAPLDQIRDYFKEYIRLELKEEYSRRYLNLQALEKRRSASSEDIEACEKLTDEIDQEYLEISKLNEKTAKLASALLKLYKSIYDPDEKEGLFNAAMTLFRVEDSKYAFESFEEVTEDIGQIAPHLLDEIKQIFAAIKTDLAIRMQMALNRMNKNIPLFEEIFTHHQRQYEEIQNRSEDFALEGQPLAILGATIEVKKDWTERKVNDLTSKLQTTSFFDPRSLNDERQRIFYALKESVNPDMQLWLDSRKKEADIVEKIILHFQKTSLTKSETRREEKEIYSLIDKAFENLEATPDLFDLEIEDLLIPYANLIPVFFREEKAVNFFNAFSNDVIKEITIYIYEKSERLLYKKYDEKLDQLSMRSIKEQLGNHLLLQDEIHREMTAKKALLSKLNETLEGKREELKETQNLPEKIMKYELLKNSILDANKHKEKLKELNAHIKMMENTLDSPESGLTFDARKLLKEKLAATKKENDSVFKKWKVRHEEAQRLKEELGYSAKLSLKTTLEQTELVLQKELPSGEKVTRDLELIEAHIQDVQKTYKELFKKSEEVSLKLKEQESALKKNDKDQATQLAYDRLKMDIRRRSLKVAFELLGLHFPEKDLDRLLYFNQEKALAS